MGSLQPPHSALYLAGLCLLIAFTSSLCEDYILPSEVDLCSTRLNVEPNGEHLSSPGMSLVAYVNWTTTDPRVVYHCRMRFTTCSGCRLRVTAAADFHYPFCDSPQAYRTYNSRCVRGCSYVHLYDRDYTTEKAMTYTSSGNDFNRTDFPSLKFQTESSILYVIACSNRSTSDHVYFSLNISAEEKTQIFQGHTENLDNPNSFSSPFFPEGYWLNSEDYTYIFQAESQNQFIIISFDDWQLSPFSSIQFDRANIKGVIMGTYDRPWIISDSHILKMTFTTGPVRIPGSDKASKGFRATYTFRTEDRDLVPYVHTDCGQGINDLYRESGIITFNPTGNGLDYYDCIWIVKKHPGFQNIMVQVISLTSQDTIYRRNQPSRLEIRRGDTSLGQVMQIAYPSNFPNGNFQDHVSEDAFYVRLKGHYFGKKDFVMSYTSFNTVWCQGLFRCNNNRCISRSLLCNDIDNCGDRSDESSNCGYNTSPPGGTGGSTNPLNVGIIIPLVVSIFLIVVICLLVIFIRRCRRLSLEARRVHRRRQCVSTISGSSSCSSRQHRRHRRRDGHGGEPGGALYDPPPSYADVLNNTPIGYLNLGLADASYSVHGPIEPPSYEEAIRSPAENTTTFNFQGNPPHEDSSDSSSPGPRGHSQTNLSTSYSSDDTRPSRSRRHRRRAASLSSSDSSADGVCMPSAGSGERQREESGGRSSSSQVVREQSHPTQTALTSNSWQSIAKPEDATIEMPYRSSVDIAGHNKNTSKTSNKLTNTVRGENESQNSPVIMRLPSGGSETLPSPDPESGERRISHSSTCRLEQSPSILAPTLLSLSSSLGRDNRGSRSSLSAAAGVLSGTRSSLQQSDLTGSEIHLHHGPDALLTEGTCSSCDIAAFENQSSPQRDRQSRPSPTRNVPAHIRRAKGSSLMKHMSRSMDDISRPMEPGHADRRPGGGVPGSGLPSRQFSQSVHNIAEMPPPLRQGQRADSGDGLVSMDRGAQHHQSQPLVSSPLQVSRQSDPRQTPKGRGRDSHHHRHASRQGSTEEQRHEAGDRSQRPRSEVIGDDRNSVRPRVHHDESRGPGRSHCPVAEDDSRHDRSRRDVQAAQRRPEAPSRGQTRPQSQPRDRAHRPNSEHRSEIQTAARRLPYPDSQRRSLSGAVEERWESARHPGHSTSHSSHNARSHHTSSEQRPPYSHSLDRQGTSRDHGGDPIYQHSSRNALSLDKNYQHQPGEHQKPDQPPDARGQSRAGLPLASSARPPLLAKPDKASARLTYPGRNHHNSDSNEQDPNKNHVMYAGSKRPPPYRPPPPSSQALGALRRPADLHMSPSPADSTRPGSKLPGTHHPESDRHREQTRQWSQSSMGSLSRDSGLGTQARHTALGDHSRQNRPLKPARISCSPSKPSPGPLPETEGQNNITGHGTTTMPASHGDDGAPDKSFSSPSNILSSNMDSPVSFNPDSFTGTIDSLHSSSASPAVTTTGSATSAAANATDTTASASLPYNTNQRLLPPVHGGAVSAEYANHQNLPLDQGKKEDVDQTLNINPETELSEAGASASGAVAISPSQTWQNTLGAKTGSQPVLYLKLANADGEGEFEENDIYV